ncbi:MAG TPA: phosphate ABC transporter permease PstA [Hanamia sp.]|jgi:phosphate transport system permease protein|nr:phosphate ABC transporter permease PstA [Hanamia sp.]
MEEAILEKEIARPEKKSPHKLIEKQIARRNSKNKLFKGVIIAGTIISTLPLLLILFYIFRQGIAAIDWHFLTNLPKPVGETGGGVSNALVGSIIILLVSCIVAIPIGIIIGIYLSEETKSKLAYYCRLAVDVLQGIPSIVIGIIIYEWVVRPLGGFSAFSGSLALALMMLPSIIKSTEETLKLLPASLKEASLALGVPYYKTILKVIVPTGISGITTGVILSISRVIGETAPLLFTSFGNPFMSTDIFKPMSSLPLIIFNYATSPYEEWHQLAWGASMLLILMVLFLNIITKIVQRKWKVQF